jgi:hypothetical protein
MMERMEILNSLERGEISVNKAVSLLKRCHREELAGACDKKPVVRKGHWFKIRVNDGEGHNIRLYAPISLLSFGFSLGKLVIGSKFLEDNEGVQTAQTVMRSIDRKDMKQLVRAIKEAGQTDIVQVRDGNTFVNISIV